MLFPGINLDGVNILHSNISELISNSVRGRKNFNPIGSKEFFFVCCQRQIYLNMETSPN